MVKNTKKILMLACWILT